MQYERLKVSDKVQLDGVAITTEYHGEDLHSIMIMDASGKVIKIAKENFSNMFIYVPKMETSFILIAQIKDGDRTFEFKDFYNDEGLANNSLQEMVAKYDNVDAKIKSITLPAGTDIKEWLNKK